MYRKKYHIHFVGIGGIGMSGIAELLLNLGYYVSGSDLRDTDITQRLVQLGGTVVQGHDASNVTGADVVVTSSAVVAENPEVIGARQAGIPVIPRAEMLAELMRLKYSIAVAGSHGKTTTTSIIAAVLGQGGLDPTVVIGGKLRSVGTNALLGQGDFIVAEADESDGSFLKMSPTIAVVTNIDREHLDFYPDLAAVQAKFLEFLDRIPFYGRAVLCLDDEPVQALIPNIKKPFVTYGMSTQADFQARRITYQGLQSRFDVIYRSTVLGEIILNLPGQHNVYNALASIAVGMELEIPFEVMKQALETLAGVQRRMEVKGETHGVLVVDDYGHHPTEIKATLLAAMQSWPERRKVVVFQPHRYSRTAALFDEFTRAFYHSDVLLVLPIYAASEEKMQGVDSEQLCEAICAHGHRETEFMPDAQAVLFNLKKKLRPNDLLLTMGAGDVWKVGMALLENWPNETPDKEDSR
ncbi:MAG: UDP-N-acetylmuramate--L-alanine ligase [Desulfobacterales bacterium]|jgi:UDP-N-acetylmuramate--alanine ligase|nr:UDP-N-acetylmuramate--L-alanine ligase [Desulfobacterales bacterium]